MPEWYSTTVWVAYELGLRIGEVLALQRKHVDLKARTIRVEQALARDLTTDWFQSPKTKSSRRTLPISAELAGLLATHMRQHAPHGRDALVFGTANGQPFTNMSKVFARARHAAGRDDLHFHDIRHTSLTAVASLGVPTRVIQKRGGHSTMKAAEVCQHAADDAQVTISNRMGETIRSAMAG